MPRASIVAAEQRRRVPLCISTFSSGRKIVLALFIAVLPTLAAAQQTSRPSKPSKKVDTLHSASGNPCAKYGVGFAKVAGSDTCIKIGGSVGVEAGGSSRR